MPTFWDLAYQDGSYREHWDAPGVPPELAALVEGSLLTPGATVVDVGCGSGLEAVYLATEGFRVLGIDLSPSALARARRRGLEQPVEAAWCVGRARTLPLGDETVDLLLDRGCFHLLEPETRPPYAAELARILRPGGLFLLRGARQDDEWRGVFGLDPEELDLLFPPERFRRGPLVATPLEAAAGDLAGYRVLLVREPR